VIPGHRYIVYLPVIPTKVSKSSVNAAKITGGAKATQGRTSFQTNFRLSSRPNKLRRLFLRVTVIIGNDVESVKTGNRAKK
jgi:hypothetical protein